MTDETQAIQQTPEVPMRVGRRLRMSESWRRFRYRLGWDDNSPRRPEEVFGSAAMPPQQAAAAAETAAAKGKAKDDADYDSDASSLPPGMEKGAEAPAPAAEPDPLPTHKLARGTRNECKALDARYTKKGDVVLEPSSKPFDPVVATVPNQEIITLLDEYCLIVTRTFDQSNVLLSTTLKIQSPFVVRALRSIVKYYPDNPVDVSNVITVPDPPALIYHYRKELKEFSNMLTVDDTAKLHIDYLFAYLRFQIGAEMESMEKHLAKGLIKCHWLWMIFRPGDLVYSPDTDELYYFKRGDFPTKASKPTMSTLHCYNVDYDGKNVGQKEHTLSIPAFSDPRELSSLPFIPLKLLPKGDAIKRRLAERGRKFLALRGIHSQQHKTEGRVVIDRQFHNERSGAANAALELKTVCECVCAVCKKLVPETAADYDHQLRELPYDQLILCSGSVSGFSLVKHTWATYKVNDLEEVQWNDKAIDGLVMEEKQKQVILSLTTSNIFLGGHEGDVIGWKGKGLVVLLHGDPGTGKTLTAECVCEHLKRPLYLVNGGELGSTPESVESKLKELLALSTRWKAIILIDEADVFLEERSNKDIIRNSLVSVFLRQLEYFTGMLFLTTNRVSSFDNAFISRIHLALHYPSLAPVQRLEVWVNAIKRFPASQVNIDYKSHALRRLAEENVNGRAISYAVRTAMALAQAKGNKLTVEVLSDVVSVYQKFNDAVTQGASRV